MKKATLVMSAITICLVGLGAAIPYISSAIQDNLNYSKQDTFDSPEINIKLNSSNSLLSNLQTYTTYDSSLMVNGAMKMTETEVVSSLKKYVKRLNEIGFMGNFYKEEDLVVSADPELCYSSTLGESTFIWNCIIGTEDKEYLSDVVVDDTTGQVISISMEQESEILSEKDRSEFSTSSNGSETIEKASQVVAKYLDLELEPIKDKEKFVNSYLNETTDGDVYYDSETSQALEDEAIKNEKISKSQENTQDGDNTTNSTNRADSVSIGNTINYDSYPGLGSREADSSIIGEGFYRVNNSNIYYRIAFSVFPGFLEDERDIYYWNIVPFYTVQ